MNRLWQQVFGTGLVKTSEDFGTQGETPAMQDLLDHLAVEFRESGWDVKTLMRRIVLSRTYRQSSQAREIANGESNYQLDPANRWLSRGPRFRIPSWMIRDQALAASGLLVPEIGGAPVNTYQPSGIWEEATFGKKKYTRDSGDKLYRRSLYTFWRRIIAPPAFFDNAGRSVCTIKPFRTNTPLHALYTLNDTTFTEAARVMAQNALRDFQTDPDRLKFAFRQVLGRPPTADESTILLAALGNSRQSFAADPESATAFLAHGESPRDEALDATDHAAWTALCLAILNFDESVSKE